MKTNFKPNHVMIDGEEYKVENHQLELAKGVHPDELAKAFKVNGRPEYKGYWFIRDAAGFVFHVPGHDPSLGHKEYIIIKSIYNHLSQKRDWYIAGYDKEKMEQELSRQGAMVCHHCKTVSWSLFRHDYHSCECEEKEKQIFVDGGTDYFRAGYGKDASYTPVTINHLTKQLTKGYDNER